MRIKYVSIFAPALAALLCGCVAHRVAEVDIYRFGVVANGPTDVTTAQAIKTFYDVSDQFQLSVIGPIKNPVDATKFSYQAGPSKSKAFSLNLEINSGQIIFLSEVVGTKSQFVDAQNAASLFEQELSKRGIKSYATKRTDFLGP
jgi:hypothetical protein